MNAVKPGYKTTEFWGTVLAQFLAIAVLIGVLSPADSETIGVAISKSIEAVGVLMANAAVILGYIKSRTIAKGNKS